MANPEHVELVKQGAESILRWLEINPGQDLDLFEAELSNADLSNANLSHANLQGAYLGAARLDNAQLDYADLSRAHLPRTVLREAFLVHANLTRGDLTGADLSEANLFEADLHGADLSGANLYGTILLGVRGAEHTLGLETVHFTPASDIPHHTPTSERFTILSMPSETGANARYIDTCERPWPESLLDWERLRVVGRLPLFGISYTTLILIPIIFYGLALYNDNIEIVRTWADQVAALPDHPLHRLAPLVLERLHPRPVPRQSFLLLLSTLLLAVGSTLYTFFSPSRIKEFSRDQWCDQIGRSLLHYWPLAWKHRYIRLACTACYALGGAGALWVLGTKVWQTALFIVKHSTFPWPWR